MRISESLRYVTEKLTAVELGCLYIFVCKYLYIVVYICVFAYVCRLLFVGEYLAKFVSR